MTPAARAIRTVGAMGAPAADPVGVLALGWNERAEALSAHVAGAVRTLAAEAAIALERAALLASLEESARTDDLTGLPNRRAWEERLPRELARSRRERQPVCVVMLDVDRFKDFNDREGHQAGDRLLKLCAASWANQLRVTDVLVRYGGDEFSLVLTGCTLEDARVLVERLRDVMPEGQTVSAGIAAWDELAVVNEIGAALAAQLDFGAIIDLVGERVRTIFDAPTAYIALYDAKRAGRDRVISAMNARG